MPLPRHHENIALELHIWNLKFHFEQENQVEHLRDCKIWKIKRGGTKSTKAEFPFLRIAWLSLKMSQACLEYKNGAGGLGYSVQFHNLVPRDRSPGWKALELLAHVTDLTRVTYVVNLVHRSRTRFFLHIETERHIRVIGMSMGKTTLKFICIDCHQW